MLTPPRPRSCFACPSRPGSEFADVPAEGLVALDRAKVQHRLAAGQVLFHQGARCAGVHCVTRGVVALRRSDVAGATSIVRLARAGEALGIEALFAGRPHAVSAEALDDTETCYLDREVVERLVARFPALTLGFLRRVSTQLQAADDERHQLVSLPVRDRLLRVLAALADRDGVEAGAEVAFRLPLSRQDLAALIGARPESVARATAGLQAEGLARFDGRSCALTRAALDEAAPGRAGERGRRGCAATG